MLKIGLVGLPNAGKSTIFSALTNQSVLIADYPFATIKPTVGIIPLPDDRLQAIGRVCQSRLIKPAPVSFVDIAGLIAGASRGQGLGNQFLANLRPTTALAHVIRTFDLESDPADPSQAQAVIDMELRLADHQTLTGARQHRQKAAKADKALRAEIELIDRALDELDDRPLRLSPAADSYRQILGSYHLLTLKPLFYVFNLAEADRNNQSLLADLKNLAEPETDSVDLCGRLELDLARLDQADEAVFRREYDLSESGLERLARVGWSLLGLQTFFTAGPKEARAWTIKRHQTAVSAAGVIHSDFVRDFIAADVIDWQLLVESGSWPTARSNGVVRTEGRDYQLVDGEVVEFKLNRPSGGR